MYIYCPKHLTLSLYIYLKWLYIYSSAVLWYLAHHKGVGWHCNFIINGSHSGYYHQWCSKTEILPSSRIEFSYIVLVICTYLKLYSEAYIYSTCKRIAHSTKETLQFYIDVYSGFGECISDEYASGLRAFIASIQFVLLK